MSRTIPGSISTDIAAGRSTLSRCVRLDLRDGTSLGITDHDSDMSVNLGDGSLVYASGTGAIPSAISLSIGLEADNLEIRGPLTDLVSAAAILGGRFDRARARVFDADWTESPAGFIRLLYGKVSGARIEAGAFIIEIRSVADAFNQTIGRVLSPYCSHDLGDAKCQVDLGPFTFPATVASVTDDLGFTVTYSAGTPGAGALAFGVCEFLTGDLAGTVPVEVFSESAGAVSLYAPAAEAPQIGDTLNLIAGCDKLRSTCRDTFANAINFGGFPDAPGSSQYLKFPVPGSSA